MKRLLLICLLAGMVHAAGTVFSTVLAGGGQEYATAVASDAAGNTYVVGLTTRPTFRSPLAPYRPPSAAPATRL